MFAKVVAQSMPDVSGMRVSHLYQRNSENLSGLFANVCYSSGYEPSTIEPKLKDFSSNLDRFNRVAGTGHHSIADHTSISVYLGEIGKITAMVLNSLAYYATSERSGRYTDMSKTASQEEREMYSKWMDILVPRIHKEYPEIDPVRVKKLAQENARYFIDVTRPYTSMVYTATYRQWSYIAQWFTKFLDATIPSISPFRAALCRDFKLIRDFILEEGIGNVDKLHDIKNRDIEFLTYQTGNYFPTEEQYGRMYTVIYDCSFSCLAQAQRHRTLKYIMSFDDTVPHFDFYVPEIVSDLTDEWNHDMQVLAVNGFIPQGISIKVAEMGDVKDFILKCEERLCGRAQREVAMLTKETLGKLYFNTTGDVNEMLQNLYIPGERCKAKCELIGTCSEACEFKAAHAVDRLI